MADDCYNEIEKNNTNMKLYQQLNEARTQGEWEPVIMRFPTDPKEIVTGVGIELKPDYKEVVFDSILPDDDEQYVEEHARIKANAQYTALCVNNLDKLGDIVSEIISWGKVKDGKFTFETSEARLLEYKQALSRIS